MYLQHFPWALKALAIIFDMQDIGQIFENYYLNQAGTKEEEREKETGRN